MRLKQNIEIQDPWFDKSSNPAEVGEIFHIVVDCIDDLGQRSLAAAFSSAGLSPENPFHWGYVMQNFAEAHYGKREPGRPKTRTPTYKNSFWAVMEKLAKENPGFNKGQLFEEFAKQYGGKAPFDTLQKESAVRTTYYKLKRKKRPSVPKRDHGR